MADDRFIQVGPFQVPRPFATNGRVKLAGVKTNIARLPAALERAFDVDDPAIKAKLAARGYTGVIVTDAMDTFRTWASQHKLGHAIDMSLSSVPNIPPIQIEVEVPGRNGKIQKKTVTLEGNKAKEQFLADMATYLQLPKTAASYHNVGFGPHIHIELGDGKTIKHFNPAFSVPGDAKGSTQALSDAQDRLRQVFQRLGMDPDAALKRIKDESNALIALQQLTGAVTRVADAVTDGLGFNDRQKQAAQQAHAQATLLAKKANFTAEGGDDRFAGVHDWVLKGKGQKPDMDTLKAYQAMLAARGHYKGDIDGKTGELTRTAAANLQKEFPTLSSTQVAQAALTRYTEGAPVLTANTPAKPDGNKQNPAVANTTQPVIQRLEVPSAQLTFTPPPGPPRSNYSQDLKAKDQKIAPPPVPQTVTNPQQQGTTVVTSHAPQPPVARLRRPDF